MIDTQKRIKNPEDLNRLAQQLKARREQRGLAQDKVGQAWGMQIRQATVSKIEHGGNVTLDTLISYAAVLGLEVALVPVGYASVLNTRQIPAASRPLDLLEAFADLRDEA